MLSHSMNLLAKISVLNKGRNVFFHRMVADLPWSSEGIHELSVNEIERYFMSKIDKWLEDVVL